MPIPLLYAPESRPVARPVLPAQRMLRPVLRSQPDLLSATPDALTVPDSMQRMARGLVMAVLEVLQGRRPVHQLAALFDEEAQAALGHLKDAAAGDEISLRSLRSQMPSPRVVEVVSHLRYGTTSQVVAFRLEPNAGGWRCSHLEYAANNSVITYASAASSA